MKVRDEYIVKRSEQLARRQITRDGRVATTDLVQVMAQRFKAQAAREFDDRDKVNPYAYGVPRTSGNMGVISGQRKSANRTSSLARMSASPEEVE